MAAASEDEEIQRTSKRVWCRALRQWAVVSVIERSGGASTCRFVQWCSLRCGEPCDEHCLDVDPRPAAEISPPACGIARGLFDQRSRR